MTQQQKPKQPLCITHFKKLALGMIAFATCALSSCTFNGPHFENNKCLFTTDKDIHINTAQR